VLARGSDGPGAAALVRDSDSDLFGLGAREAARAAALRDDPVALTSFPRRAEDDPEPFAGLRSSRDDVEVAVSSDGGATRWAVSVRVTGDAGDDALIEAGRLIERSVALAAAHRLVEAEQSGEIPRPDPSWRALHSTAWVPA